MHGLGLCHLDVRLDNILVFRSDFSWVKLCDFGAVQPQGAGAVKKSELLPYCPPELALLPSGRAYSVDRAQDVFQFGVVAFFCVFGALPWQRATADGAGGGGPDPGYAEFAAWRAKRPGSRTPRAFKPLTSRGQKLFRKLMDVDPCKRLPLAEVQKYADDRWLKKGAAGGVAMGNDAECERLQGGGGGGNGAGNGAGMGGGGGGGGRWLASDGVSSQLTMGSFRSVHSNAVEKNRVLFTLLQHGVETTVDHSQKNSRIINWIRHGRPDAEEGDEEGQDGEGPTLEVDEREDGDRAKKGKEEEDGLPPPSDDFEDLVLSH